MVRNRGLRDAVDSEKNDHRARILIDTVVIYLGTHISHKFWFFKVDQIYVLLLLSSERTLEYKSPP